MLGNVCGTLGLCCVIWKRTEHASGACRLADGSRLPPDACSGRRADPSASSAASGALTGVLGPLVAHGLVSAEPWRVNREELLVDICGGLVRVCPNSGEI